MRTDAHVHLLSGKPESLYQKYFEENQITTIIGIYDNIFDLNRIKVGKCNIHGFYWMHDLKKLPEHVPEGLKFESWLDKIEINQKNLSLVLKYAKKNDIPLLIHCNQLRYDLSRPSYVAEIAKKYKDINFIIAHSGSYAPPLPDKLAGIEIMETLVIEAINACKSNDNIFLETSILASARKRKLIIENIDKIGDRLLLGTDFPLSVNQLVISKFTLKKDYAPTMLSEEKYLINDGLSNKVLKEIYSNIYKIF